MRIVLRSKWVLLGSIVAVPFVILVSNVFVHSQDNNKGSASGDGKVMLGGVSRPKSDALKRVSQIEQDRKSDRVKKGAEDMMKVGKQPAVALDANRTVARLHETVMKGNTKSFALRTQAPPFDYEVFKKDPSDYLEQFAPNRVFQVAQPSPKIPILTPLSRTTQNMFSGEVVRLQVRTTPGYPATFASLDLGTFENKLNVISVIANDEGIAEAKYTATPGTVNRSHVLVGSPGASEQVSFELRISLRAEKP